MYSFDVEMIIIIYVYIYVNFLISSLLLIKLIN